MKSRSQKTLLKTGALQDAIFNSAHFSSIATDAKGVIQIFNVGAERMLGYTAAEVMNKITPADISDPQEVIARAKALSLELGTTIKPGFEALAFKASRGIEDIYERTYIRKDGSRFPAVVSVTALRDAQDAIIGYLLIGTDNTARKQAEEALLKAGALQSAIFNSANFSSIATDAKGVIQIFNVGAERMLGYTAAEVMNKNTPADISDPLEVIARAKALSLELGTTIMPGFEALVFKASRGIEDIYELTYIRKDGSRFPAVVSVTALRDAQDAIIGYLLIGTDNTARKHAEEALLKAGALQSAIFNSANFSSIATDAKGVIQIFNVGAERMLGYTAAEVMNKITPADISDPQEVIARAKALSVELGTAITPGFEALVFKATRGIEDIYELTYVRKNGSRFPALVSVTALRDPQDAIIGYLLIGTDNTARQEVEAARARAEQAVLAAKNEAEQANAAKDTFLATMSHEIRTPLNGLLGMMELLALSRLDSEQRETLEIAQFSGRGLVRIIDDVLDHSKIAAGKLEIRLEPVSIARLLHRVVHTFHAVASANDLTLRDAVDSRISPSLLTDPMRVLQILNNLVSNALKFTTQGYVEVRAELLERGGGADTVRLSVKDTGIGIEPEAQKRLFQPFEQAGAITARLYGGTGLGLSISRRLAEMLGGTIQAKSAPGEGTTMSVTLTLPISDAEPANLVSGAMPVVTPIFVAPTQSVGPLVLAVDDHPTNRQLLARQIVALGLRVRSVASGEEALALWQAGRYALVVTDCNMPRMDGYALSRNIREIEAKESRRRTPIIAWTANVLSGATAQCHAAGMDDILTKPAELAELKEMLSRWLPSAAAATIDADAAVEARFGRTQVSSIDLIALDKIAATPVERAEILLDFMTQTRSDFAALTAALIMRSLPVCVRIAHRMKGSSLMVGAQALAAACESMESAARQSSMQNAAAAKAVIDRALEKLEAHIAGPAGAIEMQHDAS
jgi:signal transduction histidine kinase/DNA-binding response OmpR family regulator